MHIFERAKQSFLRTPFCWSILTVIAFAYILTAIIPHKFNTPQRVVRWDVKSYYTYLPACFIDHDIAVSQWEHTDEWIAKYWPVYVGNDKFVIKTTMGVAIFYLPFFAVANAVAGPLGYATDGFSAPYTNALMVSGAVFAWLGLLLLFKLLRRRFSDKVTACSLAIIGLCSPLLWYATYESPMSHSYSFFLFAAFLYLTTLWYEKSTWTRSTLLGLTFGLITLVRPSNGLVVIVFLLYGLTSWKDIPARFKLYLKQWPKIAAIVFFTFLVWVPQFIYWKYITTHWIYYSYGNERFFWGDPKIVEVLFGWRKGLFVYAPVLLFALWGIVLSWKRDRGMFWPIVLFSVLNVYIISCWWCWWYGGGFSMRPLVDSLPLLAIPLAVAIGWCAERKRWLRYSLFVVMAYFSVRSCFHIRQYYCGVIHYEGMTRAAFFHSYWDVKPPADFWDYIDMPDYDNAINGIR